MRNSKCEHRYPADQSASRSISRPAALAVTLGAGFVLALATIPLAGCGGGTPQKESQSFFTSGSSEADQRASERMAKAEQLSGSGEGAGEKGTKKSHTGTSGTSGSSSGTKGERVEGKRTLYERLGGEVAISNIVMDFTMRVLDDPRVDWQRKGVKRGGFSIHRGQSVAWDASTNNVAQLQKHLVQFFSLATGGPAQYDGKQIKTVHAYMHISNPEFDAAVGDLKASLDRLQIANTEERELLAIVESTRPEIVTER